MVQPGEQEPLKLFAHSLMGLWALVFVGYNARAWWIRREPHLARNVWIYGGLVCLEWYQASRHWRHAMRPARTVEGLMGGPRQGYPVISVTTGVEVA